MFASSGKFIIPTIVHKQDNKDGRLAVYISDMESFLFIQSTASLIHIIF